MNLTPVKGGETKSIEGNNQPTEVKTRQPTVEKTTTVNLTAKRTGRRDLLAMDEDETKARLSKGTIQTQQTPHGSRRILLRRRFVLF